MRWSFLIALLLLIAATFNGCGNPSSTIAEGQGGHNSELSEESVNDGDTVLSQSIRVQRSSCDIARVDSLDTFSYYIENKSKALFSIAIGGNIECIKDSIVYLNNEPKALFTIADYGQEDQIYYIIYQPERDTIVQSERINLPFFGVHINDFRKIEVSKIESDSIQIEISGVDKSIKVGLMQLDCDSLRVVNYFEYQ